MNWQPILRELLRYTTLRELGRVVEITYQTLGKLAVGYEIDIGFVKGMRLLALHDYVAKQTESGRVLDRFRMQVMANLEGAEPRAEKARRVAADRASRLRAMGGRREKVAAGEVVRVAGRGEA